MSQDVRRSVRPRNHISYASSSPVGSSSSSTPSTPQSGDWTPTGTHESPTTKVNGRPASSSVLSSLSPESTTSIDEPQLPTTQGTKSDSWLAGGPSSPLSPLPSKSLPTTYKRRKLMANGHTTSTHSVSSASLPAFPVPSSSLPVPSSSLSVPSSSLPVPSSSRTTLDRFDWKGNLSPSPLWSGVTPPPSWSRYELHQGSFESYIEATLYDDDDDDEDDLGVAWEKVKSANAKAANGGDSKPVSPPPPFKPTTLPIGVDIGSPCYSRHLHCFFPAVLRAFEPAQTLEDQAKKKDRYTVYQQGGPTQVLDRRSVVFEVDPMIAICVLGHMESEDEKRITGRRVATPELDFPPELDALAFHKLDWPHTLVAIRPHLARIIAEQYAPAQWRVDKFFESQSARKDLRADIDVGNVSEDEQVEQVLPELRRWALAAVETEQDTNMSGSGWAGSQATSKRPAGTTRFEALKASNSDLLDYLQYVLMPEAFIAISIRASDDQETLDMEADTQPSSRGDIHMTTMGPDLPPPYTPQTSEEHHAVADASATDRTEENQSQPTTQPPISPVDDHAGASEPSYPSHPPLSPEFAIYQEARETLRALQVDNDSNWSLLRHKLRQARQGMRKKLGLPAEVPVERMSRKERLELKAKEDSIRAKLLAASPKRPRAQPPRKRK